MLTGNISIVEAEEKIEKAINDVYGTPKTGKWIAAESEFQFYFNEEALRDKKN